MSIELIKENNRAMFVFFTEDIYKNYMCNLFEEQYKTSNKEKLNQLGKNAKKRAIEEFTWEIVSNKYLSLIKS